MKSNGEQGTLPMSCPGEVVMPQVTKDYLIDLRQQSLNIADAASENAERINEVIQNIDNAIPRSFADSCDGLNAHEVYLNAKVRVMQEMGIGHGDRKISTTIASQVLGLSGMDESARFWIPRICQYFGINRERELGQTGFSVDLNSILAAQMTMNTRPSIMENNIKIIKIEGTKRKQASEESEESVI